MQQHSARTRAQVLHAPPQRPSTLVRRARESRCSGRRFGSRGSLGRVVSMAAHPDDSFRWACCRTRVTRSEAGLRRRWRRDRGPSRRRCTRAGRPSGRTRGLARAGSGRPDVVPVEDVLAEGWLPSCRRRRQRGVREPLRRRVRVGEEGGFRVARIAGPPSDLDLLGIPGVAGDEVGCRRLDRLAGEEAHGEVERAPPRVDGGGAAAVGRTEAASTSAACVAAAK